LVARILSSSTTIDSRCIISPANRKIFMAAGGRQALPSYRVWVGVPVRAGVGHVGGGWLIGAEAATPRRPCA
jgi:hypothetical protein